MMPEPGRFRLATGPLLGVLLLAGISVYVSYFSLWHTDVWGHTRYGQWYWEHRASPAVEPLSPFTDKEAPFADVAWLSQVSYHLAYQAGAAVAGGDAESRLLGGVEGLRVLHQAVFLLRFVLLWLALWRFGGSWTWAALGVGLYMLAVGVVTVIQRPQAFGLLFFTAILFALSTPTLRRPATVWLPLMFLLWANLHGTFLAGLMMLGLHTAGRAVERGLSDPEVRRLARVGVLCGLATLVNPHGVFLVKHALAFSAHPNVRSMTEWYPMRLKLAAGPHWPYLAGLLLLAFVRVVGGRRVGAAGWLVALPFAVWPWFQVRMIWWWWTVAMWLLARLGPGLADRFPTLPSLPDRPPSRINAWIALAAVVIAVLFLPPVRSLLPGVTNDLTRAAAPESPWQLALELTAAPADEGRWLPGLRQALRDHYPDGRFRGALFTSETQGDFLFWALPPKTPVLMYTHAQVFTPEHWTACMEARHLQPGWAEFLATHRANLVVIEERTSPELAAALRTDPAWQVVHDGPYAGGGGTILLALRRSPL